MSVPTGLYCYSHCCPLLPRFVLLFVPDGISLLFSTDEENLYLLLRVKGGRDRLILITLDGDFGLWFPGWTMSNIFPLFLPDRQRGMLSLYWWIRSANSLTVNPFFFTFVLSSRTNHYLLCLAFCSADWMFTPKSLNKAMNQMLKLCNEALGSECLICDGHQY